ncbi:MAG: hypothetical protein RIF33_25245 [Cyclobacteriaceae bacterium]
MVEPVVSSSEPTETEYSPNRVEDQIRFIREKFGIISHNMTSDAYSIVELKDEYGGGWTEYVRASEGSDIRYASKDNYHDHGGDMTSYYFWDSQLIFKFEEGSFWVGDSDEVSEKRTYYLGENKILCLTKSLKGTGGYDVVKKALLSVPNDTLECNGQIDRQSIKELLAVTENQEQELGVLLTVEDAPYPMFVLSVHFPKRNETVDLNLDLESGIIPLDSLNELIGETVMVSYKISHANINVYEIVPEGQEASDVNPDWKTTSGTLQGAQYASGDLPDEVYIVREDGSEFRFETFINSRTIEANGKNVTTYYSSRETKTITSIEPSDENQDSAGLSYFICYNEDGDSEEVIWIGFSADEKAMKVKYKSTSATSELVFDKMEVSEGYPQSTTYYNVVSDEQAGGVYALTHSGNWDYVSYITADDGTSRKFTIDHNANPYGESTCF